MPSPAEVFGALLDRAAAPGTEDDYIAAISDLGVDPLQARSAYQFAQTAWARSVLAKLPVTLADDYVVFGDDGRAYERAPLSSASWYVAAAAEAEGLSGREGFQTVVMMSAEFNAVNNALNAGSKPEDLLMLPVFIYPPHMSVEAWELSQKYIQAEVGRLKASLPIANQDSKPWWKFW